MDRKINISLLCLGLFQMISGQPVMSKPQLTNSGIVIQVLEGDSVTFPCRTSNLEDFVVLWRNLTVLFVDVIVSLLAHNTSVEIGISILHLNKCKRWNLVPSIRSMPKLNKHFCTVFI